MKQAHFIDSVIAGVFLVAAVLTFQSSEKPASQVVPLLHDAELQLTIDRTMQAHPGALVAVSVPSGAVVASSNLRFAGTTVQSPGSTLKPFVLMALLELNRLDPAQRLVCKRKLQIGLAHLDCTHPASVAQLTADEAIAYSCNSYFAQVSVRLTGAELAAALRRAGLDSPSGLIENDAAGIVRTPANKDQIQLEALGDDGVEVTPLELLEAYRKLALRKRNGEIGRDAPVFDGLEHSVLYGMARAASVEDMKVAGKTGTAASRTNPGTHGFFVGYAPAEKPEIAIVVFIQQGRGMDAAALAQQVFKEFARENHRK